MKTEILIDGGIFETRIALVEDARLVEIAHVPLGSAHGFCRDGAPEADRTGSLEGYVYLGRVTRVAKELNAAFVALGEGITGFLPGNKVHEGQACIVRVVKDAVGGKGPRLSLDVAGFEDEAGAADAPRLLWAGEEPIIAALNKILPEPPCRILVSHPGLYAFLVSQNAHGVRRAEKGDNFAERGIEEEIEQALESQVRLAQGGSLIIEKTSALTAIDVNAGSMSGDNVRMRVNLEAARTIPEQLRLRGIGGQIVIDFLASRKKADRTKIMQALRSALHKDPANTKLHELTDAGLVAAIRERRFRPLASSKAQPMAGVNLLMRALKSHARQNRGGDINVLAAPDIVSWIRSQPGYEEILRAGLGRNIILRSGDDLEQQEFDIR